MRATTLTIRGLAWMIIAMLFISPGIPAEGYEQPEQIDPFRQEELDQMLAPIALYPDSLIAQILMASTYPLEIVQAERWLEQNKTLTGNALDDALKEKSWDPSIKSLCHFPDVLFAMSDKLDQTSKLGDAFLSQNDDVMATVQQLRRKAEMQGNLMTTKEQKVIHEEDTIRIEPAARQVVYVPVYDPLHVYGPWWHPSYPPYYWHYPTNVILTGGFIAFRPHFFVGINLFSWSWFDWHRRQISIDVHKASRFHRFRQRHVSHRYFWRHNPVHRRGVAYRNKKNRIRFGQKLSRRSSHGKKMRGFPVRRHKAKAIEPLRNSIKRSKPVDVSRIRTERKRIQRTEKRWKKAAPGAKIRKYPVRRYKAKTIEPSKNYIKHRKPVDVSRIRTERKRVQRTEKRRERAGVLQKRTERERIWRTEKRSKRVVARKARPGRKKLQITEGRNSPSQSVGKENFKRTGNKQGVQSRQRGDTRYRGGNLKRQGKGFRGRSGS